MRPKVVIERCSLPGAWWQEYIGRTITILYTDSHGHWTRDTHDSKASGWGSYPFLQWIKVEDVSPSFNGLN